MQDVEAHYALIGIGEDGDYLRNLSQELGLRNRVHFLGHVDAEDLPRWYNACDVFAMPNREINGDTEGFGMVFIEAAACGKPSAIAGEAGGTGAAVLDGKTGHRVDGSHVTPVAAALYRVLADPDSMVASGAAALDRARNEFGWDRVADKTRRLDDAF
jgi:phosphatidyl-myo-inositol dimannoside synthase